MLGGDVVALRAIDLVVVELPFVFIEVARAGERAVARDRLPAIVVDRARAEHRVVLRRAHALGRIVVERVAHAHTLDLGLRVAIDCLGRLDTADVEDRRDEIDRVVVLITHCAGDAFISLG
jgi:hypothetical protein